jgi:ribosomal protein S18 acetylase RimI-like enzyme
MLLYACNHTKQKMLHTPEITLTEIPHTEEYASLINDASRLLSHEAYNDHVSPERIVEQLDAGRMVVATSETQGLIGAGVLRLADNSASISGIAVSASHRGEGLGTKIMAELEKVAVANQAKTIYLTPTNNRAASLYARLGYHAPNEDILTLEKSVEPDTSRN